MVTTSKMEEYLCTEEESLKLSKLKKGKLKTKKLLKITIVDEQEPSVQSADSRQNQSSASLNLRKQVFTKTWKLAIAASMSENK